MITGLEVRQTWTPYSVLIGNRSPEYAISVLWFLKRNLNSRKDTEHFAAIADSLPFHGTSRHGVAAKVTLT
jgi:hypothetical protein